jgi:2-amino-4-hydroxy-6-hydroxymethyldihydropteridine diphosphokinase
MQKRKRLNQDHTLLYTQHFPFRQKAKGGYRAILGIGGNMGDTVRRFERLYWVMQRSAKIEIIQSSPILKNPPFGYLEQDDFYNALLEVETPLRPQALLRYILHLEKQFKRKRTFQDAPRTLDIDMIFYEKVTMNTKTLTLPHHGWHQRDSVIIPLSLLYKAQR